MKIHAIILSLLFSSSLLADKGEVTCDAGDDYVIKTDNGYTVFAEWYGGRSLSEGDVVIGDVTSYGFKDVYNKRTGAKARIYVDNYK